MLRKLPISFILFMISLGCHDKNKDQTSLPYIAQKPANVDSAHHRISEMKQIAKRVFLNENGFWEAELDAGHLFVYVPEGEFIMGSHEGLANEKPVRKIYLDGYWMGKYPAMVSQFKMFVEASGYLTDAEKGMGSWQWSENGSCR